MPLAGAAQLRDHNAGLHFDDSVWPEMSNPTPLRRDVGQDGPNKSDEDRRAAARVLSLAKDGLEALLNGLDGNFTSALDLLQQTDGRVIVTGMGKSGDVAKKIAATFASTGTPAYFVHPAEASHGDLGMIVKQDTVVALSNSGETPELSDITNYVKRFGIPLIAVTSRADSAFAVHADVALMLPAVDEACPNGLAPTTSTTMMIALGDALAIAMMERKGISVTDYKTFHPGGHLAERALRVLSVADLMHTGDELPVASIETPMPEVLAEMTDKRLGCIAVTDGEDLVGVITDGDVRRHISGDILKMNAKDVMTADPRTISPGALASEAVQLMNDYEITNLLVAEGRELSGVIHIHDCMRAGVV